MKRVTATWTMGLLAMLHWSTAEAQVRDPWTGKVDPAAEQPGAQPTAEPAAQPAAEPAAQPEAEPAAQPEAEPEAQPEADPPSAPDPAAKSDPTVPSDARRAESKEPPPIVFPNLFTAPTGRLVPAAMVYSSTGVDTGGGVSSDFRVGLGNVAEFGLATTDLIRKIVDDGDSERIQPYVLATFKMGIQDDLLFKYQPGLAIGFRKSFEVSISARDTRVASVYVAASEKIGGKFTLHAGGVFWDASIKTDTTEVLLHHEGIDKQLRPFGGFEVEPLDNALIIVDLYWIPEFELSNTGADKISLVPTLSWGVRYKVTESVLLESGVRVPDIEEINLLDAQIFGQFTFVSRKLSNWLEDIR